MIELGVPYSDPLADGPVIQRAAERALRNRLTIVDCIKVGKKAREAGSRLPFILFSYYNPILQLGLETFFALLKENDISGVIIPDLPVEENEPVKILAERSNICLIPLVAPTSADRIAKIVAQASGFVYCVSSLGVTGERSSFYSGVDDFIRTVKNATALPVAIGFGISRREHVRHFSALCDGVIVGSAIVRKIEEVQPLLLSRENRAEGLRQIEAFVRELAG
jgi:tryptophan synthase alpha chain